MNDHQLTCDDSALEAMLRTDSPLEPNNALLAHMEACPRCQARIAELAGSTAMWLGFKAAISSAPVSVQPPRFPAVDLETSNVHWTEAMAKQLLSPPSHPEMLGRLGRYEVERLIGSGGMGVVFKAFDTELNRPVAIKLLAPYLASSGPARKRFSREARAAAAVVHQHVVPIHNVETEREAPFIVMQYVSGESLQVRIDRTGPLQLCEILRIGMQVADGLSAAHQQGLVHRDIKPSNILLEEDIDRALISDFGLARAADDASLTRPGFHPGTPQYMSPEQASGQSVDARSDLFSLGSTLYTMCTGHPPFRADSSYSVMRRISDEVAPSICELNPDIPEWLVLIIEKLMAKEKTDRFETASEVRDLLEACLGHVQQPEIFKLPAILTAKKHSQAQRQWTHSLYLISIGLIPMLTILIAIALGSFVLPSPSQPTIQSGKTAEDEKEVLGHGYTRQGNFIYFNEQRIDPTDKEEFKRLARAANIQGKPCTEVDAASFKALSKEYTKDKNKVYYNSIGSDYFLVVELPLADATSFEVVGSNLARDARNAWWYGELLKGVDPQTVELVKEGFVWKDATNVWYQREKLPGADAKSFRHLAQAFYRDANRVYWSTSPLDGADPDTFRTFGDDCPYGADRDNVWCGQTKLAGYHAPTFQPIHQSICKDKDGVYIDGHLFALADPKSLRKVADLDTYHAALLEDEHYHFVFLPLYGDLYRVTSTNISLNVERWIWPPELTRKGKVRAAPVATAKARLDRSGWKELTITAPPAINTPMLETRESHILNLHTALFSKAWEILQKGNKQGDLIVAEAPQPLAAPEEAMTSKPQAPKAERSSKDWQSNIAAFDAYLEELVGKGRIPDQPSLAKRVTAQPGEEATISEVLPLTDGAGGYADLSPAEDTIQFQVNEALKGKKVKWEFELAEDVTQSFVGITRLIPKSVSQENATPFLAAVIVNASDVNTSDEFNFKAGDVVTIEGTIGDASQNKGIRGLLAPSGPIAVYHLESSPHPIFWLGVTDTKISGPTHKTTPRKKPSKEVTAFAKDFLLACMIYDEKKLTKLYASEVLLLPENRLFFFGIETPSEMTEYGVPVKLEEMLPALKKQAGVDPIPSFIAGTMISAYRIEQLDVAVGDYSTQPNQPSESLYRSMCFKIQENDVLLSISVPGAFRYVQLRKIDGQWKVVAEY